MKLVLEMVWFITRALSEFILLVLGC